MYLVNILIIGGSWRCHRL